MGSITGMSLSLLSKSIQINHHLMLIQTVYIRKDLMMLLKYFVLVKQQLENFC